MKKILLMAALALSSFMAKAGDDDSFDVYLMIGQSNMAGRGEFESRDTIEPLSGVYLLDQDGNPVEAVAPFNRYSTIRKDISLQGYSPANKFSELMHARTGRKVLIVSNARGGSSVDHWQPGDSHAFLDEAVRRTLQAMKFGRLKGIAWHQGETNIQKGIAGYVEKFKTMINALRDSLGEGDVPVVIGQVGQWKWAPAADVRRFNDSVVPKISREVKNCGYVVSDGLARRYPDKERDPHFGRKAQMELGRRYAEAMTALLSNMPATGRHDHLRDSILRNITGARVRPDTINVLKFGARPDGRSDCRKAVDKAIRKASANGGGVVTLPQGVYWMRGPINLLDNVILNIEKDAVVRFDPSPDLYPIVETSWEGTYCYNYSPMIRAFGVKNVGISGEGTIDGNAMATFATWRPDQKPPNSVPAG